ncbi:MAG: hypothetical protein ACRYG2_22665 [Janthinobacterium lividum]
MSEPVRPRDTPFMSNEALASDPGGVTIDPRRMRQLAPSLYGLGTLNPTRLVVRKMLEAHLWNGDSRAAVVLSVQPLLVAAYSSDFDAVVVLRFDRRPADTYVQVGSRLLTVNTYFQGSTTARDILPGPYGSGRWSNFHPVIADFVAADPARVERRKTQISEPEWQRTWQLGQDFLVERPQQLRDGAPHRSRRAG